MNPGVWEQSMFCFVNKTHMLAACIAAAWVQRVKKASLRSQTSSPVHLAWFNKTRLIEKMLQGLVLIIWVDI